MQEEREGFKCIFAFGHDSKSAQADAVERGLLDAAEFPMLCNPQPTGDHWRVILWVRDYLKKGASTLIKVPHARRDFIKRASTAVEASGFSMEVASMAARKFRDDNDLRMLRGKVYAFVSMEKKKVDQEILPRENGAYKDSRPE